MCCVTLTPIENHDNSTCRDGCEDRNIRSTPCRQKQKIMLKAQGARLAAQASGGNTMQRPYLISGIVVFPTQLADLGDISIFYAPKHLCTPVYNVIPI